MDFQFWMSMERKKTAPASQRLNVRHCRGRCLCPARLVAHGHQFDELNIAVTHNYGGESNLCNVLRLLETRRDHVSGCRSTREYQTGTTVMRNLPRR
jgi:hypothetical protein